MNDLRQAVEMLQSLAGSYHRFSPKKGEKSTYDSIFFAGLLDGSIRSDRDAVLLLFGSEDISSTYRSFKSRFCTKLEHELLTVEIDRKKDGDLVWALVECSRKSVLVRLYYSYGKDIAAISTVRETIALAEKYHLTQTQLEMLRLLQQDAQLRGDLKDFEFYTARRKEVLRMASAEMETEEEYLRIATIAARNSTPPPKDIEHSLLALQSIEVRYGDVEGYGFRMALFRLKNYVHSIMGNHEAAVDCCNETEYFYRKYPQFASQIRMAEVFHRRMSELILMGKMSEAKYDATRLVSVLQEGTPNWYYSMTNYFELCMQLLDFQEAAEVLVKLEKYVQKKDADRSLKERVRIYKGYLWYCHHSGWATRQGSNLEKYEFIHQLPQFSKSDFIHSKDDKQGANFAVIVLDFLLHLHSDKLYDINEEAFAKYEQRYMKNLSVRSNIFAKILRIILKMDRPVDVLSEAIEPYLKQLSELPRMLDTAEILPFESVWEHILEKMKKLTVA